MGAAQVSKLLDMVTDLLEKHSQTMILGNLQQMEQNNRMFNTSAADDRANRIRNHRFRNRYEEKTMGGTEWSEGQPKAGEEEMNANFDSPTNITINMPPDDRKAPQNPAPAPAPANQGFAATALKILAAGATGAGLLGAGWYLGKDNSDAPVPIIQPTPTPDWVIKPYTPT